MAKFETTALELSERLLLALRFKEKLGEIVDETYRKCEKIIGTLSPTEGRRIVRELVISCIKSISEGDIQNYLNTLIRLGARGLHQELRIEEVFRLGDEVLGIMSEFHTTNLEQPKNRAVIEEFLIKYRSDEITFRLHQEYLHLLEGLLFRQVQELSLLASISSLSKEDFLVDTSIPEKLLERLMEILEADDGVAYFHSEFFRVLLTKFKGEDGVRGKPEKLEELLASSARSSFDPTVYSEFRKLIREGYSWDVSRRDRETMELIETFYPQFHKNPPRARAQRILDFEIQNPLLQLCSVHSYMTYDLYVDASNYGMIFLNRGNPPEFNEDDYRFLATFGGQLKHIIGNIILTQKLHEMAITDSLTGVYNRRQFEAFLENEISRARRYNYSVGLAMVDLDHFKEVNDTFGHQAGDHILAELCRVLKEGLRVTEVIARYGGEEFAVIIPQGDYDVVKVVGEKVRSLIEEHRFSFRGKKIPLTVSVGLAVFPQMAIDKESLIAAADKALYQAKQDGRNLVRFAHPIKGGVGTNGV